MAPRAIARLASSVCKPVESALEARGKWTAAQKLRKTQHELLGLSKKQWEALERYLILFERLTLILQRMPVQLEKYELEKFKLLAPLTTKEETIAGVKRLHKAKLGMDSCWLELSKCTEAMQEAEEVLKHTAVFRAFNSENPTTGPPEILREKCVRAGGCCARKCGCCSSGRHPDADYITPSHCTPACGCCQRNRGFEVKVDEGSYPRWLGFNVRANKKDLPSRRMMDALVWGQE